MDFSEKKETPILHWVKTHFYHQSMELQENIIRGAIRILEEVKNIDEHQAVLMAFLQILKKEQNESIKQNIKVA